MSRLDNFGTLPIVAASTVGVEKLLGPAKEPVTAPNKRTMVDTTNCLDTGATIFMSGQHTMQKMGLNVANLHRDQTKCSSADGSPLKILGFIPVIIRVNDSKGCEEAVKNGGGCQEVW